VHAPRDVPAFARSAMDGYAVRARDTQGASRTHPVALRLLGRVYAGETPDLAVDTGTCVEIATGAPIPEGADAVVIVEDTQASSGVDKIGGDVQVFADVRPHQNIVARAADMRAGDVLLSRGATLTASRIGAIAAIGIGEIDVYARPIVAILPTGDELTPLGTPLPAGHVYDVNRYTLAALVRQHGGLPRVFPTVRDDLGAMRDAIARVSDAGVEGPIDLVVLTGGSSVGEHDLVIDILRERGQVLFHGVAVKPGKPTALARIGERLLALAMPGNPTSCLSNAHVLLAPLLRAVARLPPHRPTIVRAALAVDVESPRDRFQFMPVRLENGRAVPTFKGSGEITSLSRADGYFAIPTHTRIEAGTLVDVTLY
jgi:molybdopterin molybdotransferase